MAATPYPIPRQIRQSDIFLGNGGSVYSGFTFKIFDILDVEVWTKATGEVRFSLAAVTVAKLAALPLDDFSVTFGANQPATTQIVVRSKRTSERSTGISKGTLIDLTALEKELSKQASVQEELRRDLDRAMTVDFGEPSLTIDDMPDGSVLMKEGTRLVEGPDASDISAAQANAAAAAASAAAANTSAGNAAASATAANIAKTDAQTAATAAAVIVFNGYGAAIHGAPAKSNLADADEFGIWDSVAALAKVTLSNLVASIFKTTRTIANAQFAAATFKLFNAAGTPRALSFITTALTADRTITMPDADIDLTRLAKLTGSIALTGAAQRDFLNIPAGTKRITISIQNMSTNGSSGISLRLGDSGGIENTGYLCATGNGQSSTIDFPLTGGSGAAAAVYQGIIMLTLLDAATNTWCISSQLGRTDVAALLTVSGSKPTSAVLDRFCLNSGNLTDLFDAGSASAIYE